MSTSEKQLYDELRGCWVAAQPEEVVRQKLVRSLIKDLGFPKSLIAIEKALDQLPHLADRRTEVPNRRADILCFGKGIHPDYDLYPLLMIECKAVAITDKVLQQVVGYNHYVQSCFVAVANQSEVQTGWWDEAAKEYRFVSGLPTYAELCAAVER